MSNRLRKRQAIVFTLSFLCMVSRHSAISAWSMVKPDVKDDLSFSNTWLGLFDFSYLAFYAIGNFVSGVLGDNYPLKRLVSGGMGLFSIVYGLIILLGFLRVESPWPYFILFAFNGGFQSAVWPGTVAVMGNWFNKETRGSVMGIWSANASFGDILGQQTAAFFNQFSNIQWEYIMITTVFYVLIAAFLFLFVEDKPDASLLPQSTTIPLEPTMPESEVTLELEKPNKKKGISFWKAWLLPGVLIYSLNYACVKLLNYGMNMWLPFFVSTQIGLSGLAMGALTSSFSAGGIIGSVTAGRITDKIGSRTLIIVPMLILAVPIFGLFRLGSSDSYWIFFILTPICGFLVNGANNLISSAVAADLAENEQVKENQEALATVAGIIDGTGGIGAAIGQPIIGLLSEVSWDLAFGFLMGIGVLAIALLIPLTIKEWRMFRIRRRQQREEADFESELKK